MRQKETKTRQLATKHNMIIIYLSKWQQVEQYMIYYKGNKDTGMTFSSFFSFSTYSFPKVVFKL